MAQDFIETGADLVGRTTVAHAVLNFETVR
jgi:hypothetical protein